MEKKMLASGRYTGRDGVITLKSGKTVTAKELVAAKKAGLTVEQLLKQVEEEIIVVPVVVEEDKPVVIKREKSTTTWTSIPRHEILASGLTKEEPKAPWYKQLLKKVGK